MVRERGAGCTSVLAAAASAVASALSGAPEPPSFAVDARPLLTRPLPPKRVAKVDPEVDARGPGEGGPKPRPGAVKDAAEPARGRGGTGGGDAATGTSRSASVERV